MLDKEPKAEDQNNIESQSSESNKSNYRKPGVLRSDIWEDVFTRYTIAKAGGNDDDSCRVHAEIDTRTGRAKVTWVGSSMSIDKVRQALKAEEIDHEEMRINSYPGQDNFPVEEAKEIAQPFIIRTIEEERKRLGLTESLKKAEMPLLALKEIIDLDYKQLFGRKEN